ncbi:trimethylamine methyltransferase family protein [Candidatus Spongiihabitans sp.]|uniref:trimethylamine methyltransferase family protein n=1 Tax=Candidatus Spongiihabitans sp. TaxID=3101308 RepID=UPI003C7E6A3B
MSRPSHRARQKPTFKLEQLPLRQLQNPYAPIQILSEQSIELIHDGSMKILERIGLQIVNDRARRLMLKHGATIDDKTGYVKMERDMVLEKIATIPPRFTLHARNPKFNSVYGGNHINFTLVASAPNCSDLDSGRRTGNYEDYCKFLKLGQTFNVIGAHSGYPVEPIDLPPHTRHLDAYRAFITLTEKPWHAYSLGNGKIEDAIEMICMARSIDQETLKKEPSIMTVVNTNSPLKVDGLMLDGLMTMAEFGQLVVVTPFTLAGAMSPVTLAGALAQQNAEALGVLAVTQMVNPGAPAMYGGFTSNVDMKSGAPAFGTPEYAKAVLAGGQLARRYNIPYRTSNVNASNCVDAQAAWESGMSLWSAVMSHGNMIKHSGGWLEGGLCASFEKLIVDMEMVQMMAETLKPIEVNQAELAFDAIEEVGAGGHFFGACHTIERYKDAFYAPIATDWRNFETWQENGSVQTAERANKLFKQILNDFEEPELDVAIREQLDEYVMRRKGEIKPDW